MSNDPNADLFRSTAPPPGAALAGERNGLVPLRRAARMAGLSHETMAAGIKRSDHTAPNHSHQHSSVRSPD